MISINYLKDLKKKESTSPNSNRIILTLLIGECERIGKDIPEIEILNIIKKIIKNNNQTLSFKQDDSLTKENLYLSEFLPIMMSSEEIESIIDSNFNHDNIKLNLSNVMKFFKFNYNGEFENNELVKSINKINNA